jgi:hypothetical protein
MARLTSDILFTGSLGSISAYKMRGSDQIILRRKGGPNPHHIKTSPSFDLVRRNNAEFSGRAAASRWIMNMLWPQKALADYNIAGPLNALVKPIQELDTQSAFGQRHVRLSENKDLLQGFSLNRKNPFDSVVRAAVTCVLNRHTGTAEVELPELLPGINFFPHPNMAFFSFQIVLGVVPDLFYEHGKYLPISSEYQNSNFAIATTPWQTTRDHQKNITFHVSVPKLPMDDAHSFILTIGIRYGTMRTDGTIEQRKHSGCAKVLAVF